MKTTHTRNGAAKVVKLKLDLIRLDAGTQTRAHIDEATVTEYAESMARGDRFPPVIAFQQNGEIILADGFHRVKAARRARLKHILAEVRQGGRTDALRFALGANHKHGLRRTNGDKRRGVEMALNEFGNVSDHLLAEMCGVSQPFVSNLRHQLITVISSKPRLGKDGKIRVLPLRGAKGDAGSNVGVSAARSRQDADGAAVNGEVGNKAFMKVAEAMAGLEQMVEDLVQAHPDETAAVVDVIGKVRSDLLQLQNRLRIREKQ